MKKIILWVLSCIVFNLAQAQISHEIYPPKTEVFAVVSFGGGGGGCPPPSQHPPRMVNSF